MHADQQSIKEQRQQKQHQIRTVWINYDVKHCVEIRTENATACRSSTTLHISQFLNSHEVKSREYNPIRASGELESIIKQA